MTGRMGDMDIKGKQPVGADSWTDADLLLSPDDQILFRTIGEFIKAESDIQEVKNDPLFDNIRNSVGNVMNKNNNDSGKRENDRIYISESLGHKPENDRIEKDIRDIRQEIRIAGIDKITSEWVDRWNRKTDRNNDKSGKRKEIREFVTGSLESRKIRSEHEKVFTLRWILATAAVVAGTIFFIRSLLLSDDPDRIFTRYYEPMSIVSSVTRDGNVIETGSYDQAVKSFNAGDYQEAAAGFTLAAERSGKARFYLGLSQIAMGNYTEGINILEGIVKGQGEYLKDATWYLGLAYLKTGESGKALTCFETLSGTPGFYRVPSEKILRRLK